MIHKTWLQGHVLIGLNGFMPKTRTHGGKHNCRKEDSTNRLTLLQLAERTGNVSTNFINKNRLPRIERLRGIVRCSGELKEKVTAFSLDATTPC